MKFDILILRIYESYKFNTNLKLKKYYKILIELMRKFNKPYTMNGIKVYFINQINFKFLD